eukprot:gnl/TRDRNA2_/TRDRNA2_155995_c1_seq1.p1 gnl/TRDRNA2_/TRDRNA2_155995_c1~~gnl/TRDRNA2_/TRDRNA2_155995_c1_seq1.p1  ORF type:complete len:207 (+),score=53.18 gnl/TRDRNA2_/TRDRNA2_155995_c1_seq1:3-623(+)
MVKQVRAIVESNINVMGHVGLLPQTAASFGGYRVQGKSAAAARELVEDALALQEAGCHAIVLECVPDRIAAHCTARLSIPTIGIGAGPHCDGQVQVFHDVMGLYDKLQPKFSRQYFQARDAMVQALERYAEDISTRAFPSANESFTMADEHYNGFLELQHSEHNRQEVALQEEIHELRRCLQLRLQMLDSLHAPGSADKANATNIG